MQSFTAYFRLKKNQRVLIKAADLDPHHHRRVCFATIKEQT